MSDPAQIIAQLDEVHLSFGSQKVLQGVNLSVGPRDRLVVMGQSGCGKSTLLRLVLGILRPNPGVVRFKGHDVTRMRRREINATRQEIGMVYQYSALISSLNVRDNLALPLEELTSKSRGEIDDLVQQKLEMVGMAETRDKMPAQLSGGMRKRVALARALMLDPSLILSDEPSAGLDPVSSSMIDELMIQTSERLGCASIIVTHELDSAFKVATRMAMLYRGRIIAEGSPDEFRSHSNPVVAQFIAGETEGPLAQTQ
jgi:phospholipid/cholesterol/gamma-HCH transport system ATP-binding protein